MNDVVLNHVLVRWLADDGDRDRLTDRVISCINEDARPISEEPGGTGCV
jgi:hypothetical protein